MTRLTEAGRSRFVRTGAGDVFHRRGCASAVNAEINLAWKWADGRSNEEIAAALAAAAASGHVVRPCKRCKPLDTAGA